MEEKGLRVNSGKTKSVKCRTRRVQSEDSGKHPCDLCGKDDFRCKRCLDEGLVVTVLQREVEIEPNVKLEFVPKFCYLVNNLNWQPSWKIVSFNVDEVV